MRTLFAFSILLGFGFYALSLAASANRPLRDCAGQTLEQSFTAHGMLTDWQACKR